MLLFFLSDGVTSLILLRHLVSVDSWLRLALTVADVVDILVEHGVKSVLIDAFRLVVFRCVAVLDVFLV